MKAQKFIMAWKEFFEHPDPKQPERTFLDEGENWNDAWSANAKWTNRTIGFACTEKMPIPPDHECRGHSPLGAFLIDKLPEGCSYQKEYKHVDLVFARKDNIRRPFSWKGSKYEQSDWDERFEPILPEILIEQETGCGSCWQEMGKLILLRSRLKVLITYTENAAHSKSLELIEQTRTQLKHMLEDAWQTLPESEETEYLLIIGRLNDTGSEPVPEWFCSIVAPNGEVVYEDPLPKDECSERRIH